MLEEKSNRCSCLQEDPGIEKNKNKNNNHYYKVIRFIEIFKVADYIMLVN